jgi:hypothetical protein
VKLQNFVSKLHYNSPTNIWNLKIFSGGYTPGPPFKRGGMGGEEGEGREGEDREKRRKGSCIGPPHFFVQVYAYV